MRARRCAYRALVGKPEGTLSPGIDGRIIFKYIFKTWDGGNGLD